MFITRGKRENAMPGAAGSGGPTGDRNGNYRHGRYAKEHLITMQALRKLLREARAMIKPL